MHQRSAVGDLEALRRHAFAGAARIDGRATINRRVHPLGLNAPTAGGVRHGPALGLDALSAGAVRHVRNLVARHGPALGLDALSAAALVDERHLVVRTVQPLHLDAASALMRLHVGHDVLRLARHLHAFAASVADVRAAVAEPTAPLTADPVADAPDPPAGRLRVVPVRVFRQSRRVFFAPPHQPDVPGAQVVVERRVVGVVGDGVGVSLKGAPEVDYVPVGVRHYLALVRFRRQQHS